MSRVRPTRLLVLALLAALTVATPMAADARADWSCRDRGTGLQDFLWSSDQDGSWSDASRWAGRQPPASSTGSYVCIRQAVTVTIGPDSGRIDLGAFELGNRTTLVVEPGTELYVDGSAGQDSLVRAGGAVVLRGATLGGTGTIVLRGTLRMESHADGQQARLATGATTQVDIQVVPQLRVEHQGRVEVLGNGPSALTDGYTVEVRGWVGIGGPTDPQASLVADHGTSFALVPHLSGDGSGTLELLDDQGFAEGAGAPGSAPATFRNEGRILKSAGTGVSRIAGAYSASDDARIEVTQGSLLLPDGTYTEATVQPGATYGTGTCDARASSCGNGTTEERPQTATLRVPARADGAADVRVTQVEDPRSRLGSAVLAHASGGVATRAAPYVIELRYDRSLLDGRTWRDLTVRHKDDGRWSTVAPCGKAGTIPPTVVACVDVGGDPDTSSRTLTGDSAGDVVMVVRTIRTSRWIAY